MKLDVVLSASKEFLRSREGFHAAPTIRGFARHIEANMRLYEAFVLEGTASCIGRLAFGIWRLVLIAMNGLSLLLGKVSRVWAEVFQ